MTKVLSKKSFSRLLAAFLAVLLLMSTMPFTAIAVDPSPSYLTFSSDTEFTLKTYNTRKNWTNKLYYSTDTTTWIEWVGTTTLNSAGGKLYLRGTGNSVITGQSDTCRWVLTGSGIACTGNIENLLDYQDVIAGNHPTMINFCFNYLFMDCTALTSAPELPATVLDAFCYSSMFAGCTALTSAPELPATVLDAFCYSSMFASCTGLTTAPELPATQLAESCYDSMFGGCTSLKVSATQTGNYIKEWRIPTTGTSNGAANWNLDMLHGTGGAFTSDPDINTTYYMYHESYITFSSETEFTLITANTTKNWDGTLEYSTNLTTWTEWSGTTTLSSADGKLYLRGTSNTKITGNNNGDYKWVLTGTGIDCTGNIENLLDYETVAAGNHPAMADYCYRYMFSGCTI